MSRLKTGIVAVTLVVMAGCSGGDDSRNLCLEVVRAVQACGLASQGTACVGEERVPTEQEICYIDCLLGATCTDYEVTYCQMDPTLFNDCDALCPAPRFDCGDGSDVPLRWQCDGIDDCANGSDEVGCAEFMCDDGSLIIERWHCDGLENCADGSDEVGCPAGTHFICGNGDQIPARWQCDGGADCADSSDEAGCPTFTCTNGDTIPANYQCDGGPDCTDGSDEVGCAMLTCP